VGYYKRRGGEIGFTGGCSYMRRHRGGNRGRGDRKSTKGRKAGYLEEENWKREAG